MEVDYSTISTRIVPLSNCAKTGVEEGGTIITVSPDIVVPDDLQGKEYAFPFLFESHRVREARTADAENLEKSTWPAQETYEDWVKGGRLPPVLFMIGNSLGVYGRFS